MKTIHFNKKEGIAEMLAHFAGLLFEGHCNESN